MNLSSSIFCCFILSISIFVQAPKGSKPSSGCGNDIPANLFINSGGNISPDPQGPMYANGGTRQNQISVGFQVSNCSFDLIVNLNNSARYLVSNVSGQGIFNAKFANFDRIASVPITTDNAAMNDFCGTTSTGGNKYDNYAGCGTDSSGRRYVRRNAGIDLGDNSHNLRFQYSPIDNPNGNPNVTGTAFIKVYHSNANTWDLLPENINENGIGEVGAFLTNGVRASSPIVPFWFTVTGQ